MQEKTRPFSSKEKFLAPELSRDFDDQVSKQVGEIIPPYDPEIPKIEKLKRVFRGVFWVVIPVILLAFFGAIGFIGYKAAGDFDTFWHHLKNNKTIAVTLTNQKEVQDIVIDDVLSQLSQPDKTIHEKLLEITISGYQKQDLAKHSLVVHDQKLRTRYQHGFEQYIQMAIKQAYLIYDNFGPQTERDVYGITAEELVYQKGLRVDGYAPMTLKSSVYQARRYFPFALIAGQIADIDPLRILKIFEIETNFTETVVYSNTNRTINDDIGIAQNNLILIPGLIRDILNPSSPIYSPYFEFFEVGVDFETGDPLLWPDYLVRLEKELSGSYNPQHNPTGRYYVNMLKAPHLGAVLAAFHVKRDQQYPIYNKCMRFYTTHADWFKQTLNLEKKLNPFHWTDYTFYNGGPKRWFVMRNFLECKTNQKSVSSPLRKAVNVIKRRNTLAQRIGEKNDYIKTLAYDTNNGQKLVENDGLFQYGLLDFTSDFEGKLLMYNLNQQIAQNIVQSPTKTQ